MNNRKYIAILAIFFGLVMLVAIVYFIFFHFEEPSAPEIVIDQKTVPVEQQPAPKEIESPKEEIKKPAVIVKREFGQEDLKVIAASFAERFGSYSNQADYGNIRDLKIFMSAKMTDWAERYIQAEISKRTSSSIYYGITTKAIAQKIEKWDEDNGVASVRVSTQRREATASMENATRFAQEVIINFIKENGAWKVDGAYWQGK